MYENGGVGCSLLSPRTIVIMSLVYAIPGMGSSRVELIQLKIVLLAAMPSARVTIATKVKPGFLIS